MHVIFQSPCHDTIFRQKVEKRLVNLILCEVVLMHNDQTLQERRRLLVTVADALTLMLMFGGFILTLIGLVVVIIQAIAGNQKDRQ